MDTEIKKIEKEVINGENEENDNETNDIGEDNVEVNQAGDKKKKKKKKPKKTGEKYINFFCKTSHLFRINIHVSVLNDCIFLNWFIYTHRV